MAKQRILRFLKDKAPKTLTFKGPFWRIVLCKAALVEKI